MSPALYTLLAVVHGHLAVLGLAALLHPVVTLRRSATVTTAMLWSAELGAALLAAPFALGLALGPHWRHDVKPPLWLEAPGAVLRFDAKEHLAAMAVTLAIAGAFTLRVAGRKEVGREAAWSLLSCALTLGTIAALFGLYVSALTMS